MILTAVLALSSLQNTSLSWSGLGIWPAYLTTFIRIDCLAFAAISSDTTATGSTMPDAARAASRGSSVPSPRLLSNFRISDTLVSRHDLTPTTIYAVHFLTG